MTKMYSRITIRTIAFLLVCVLMLPIHTQAVSSTPIAPYASNYLISYNAYVYCASSSEIQVWFSITGRTTMDDVGALSIKLYESSDNNSWTWVDTFDHTDYDQMLVQGETVHMDHVTYYKGKPGYWYKAYVCIWAGRDGGGDTRYFWTSAKQAPTS